LVQVAWEKGPEMVAGVGSWLKRVAKTLCGQTIIFGLFSA
jgi:hypothetical protein